MYPYFIVLFSIFIFYFFKIKYGKHLIFLILFLFAALRFDVGFDYHTYYDVVAGYNDYEYERFGFLDKALIDFSRFLDFYQLYFIVTSFIICFFIFRTILNYSSDFYFSTLFFFVIPIFYLNSLTIIRQYVAIALVFYSIKFVFNKNLLLFLICIFVASFFHISALVGLFLYVIPNVRFSYKKIFLMFFTVYALQFLVDKELASYIPYYSYYIQSAGGHGRSMMIFLISILIFSCFYSSDSERFSIYFNIYALGVISYCFFINFGEVGPRISLYYLIFLVLLIPEIFARKGWKIFYPLIFLLLIALFFLNFYLSAQDPRKDQYVPYVNFLMINVDDYYWK